MTNKLFDKFEKAANKEFPVKDNSRKPLNQNFDNVILPDDNDSDNYDENMYNNDSGSSVDDFNFSAGQKPESFHFFILDNQYKDLERLIRGVKDVYDKDKKKWTIKRKDSHCFTDEESEEIIRTAQSHLSPDIKLAIFNREEYPILLNSIYEQIWVLFKEIMEYRFGRFKTQTKQMYMKQQAVNIFQALMMRIKANYSRAVDGRENKETHNSVKGQESLQNTGSNSLDTNSYT